MSLVNRKDAKDTKAEKGGKRGKMPLDAQTEEIARKVVHCCYLVHSSLGPGLLESVYGACLAHEMTDQGIRFEREAALPVVYRGLRVEAGLRLDFLVEQRLIVEIKAVDGLNAVHDAQLLTYLRLSGKPLGLLVNFNVVRIKEGIRRRIWTPVPHPAT